MASSLECASLDVSEMIISALELWYKRPCTFLKRDTESIPSHGVSSRDEGGLRAGAWGCSCSRHPQSIISFSSVMSQGLQHTTGKAGFGLGSRVDLWLGKGSM